MKIGVMSDTHLNAPDRTLSLILTEILADTQMILHAGDIVSYKVLELLDEHGVVAVCGNMDDYRIDRVLPRRRIVTAAGKRIGLIHGWGPKHDLEPRIVDAFSADSPDLIVYGHSHVPFWGMVGGVWMFNPGSAAMGGTGAGETVGMIEITDSGIETRFLPVYSD